MEIIETSLQGVLKILPRKFEDSRGWFTELFKTSDFKDTPIPVDFVQDNLSMSQKGVVRGLHLQRAPHAQGKFIRCLKGRIFDVAVDLRKDSATFGQWLGFELSPDNLEALYIPPGFAHGFQALEEDTLLMYKCTNLYNAAAEDGIHPFDKDLDIQWPLANGDLSPKDLELPPFKDFTPL